MAGSNFSSLAVITLWKRPAWEVLSPWGELLILRLASSRPWRGGGGGMFVTANFQISQRKDHINLNTASKKAHTWNTVCMCEPQTSHFLQVGGFWGLKGVHVCVCVCVGAVALWPQTFLCTHPQRSPAPHIWSSKNHAAPLIISSALLCVWNSPNEDLWTDLSDQCSASKTSLNVFFFFHFLGLNVKTRPLISPEGCSVWFVIN